MKIKIKTPEEIEKMRAGGLILAKAMLEIEKEAMEGTALRNLDELAKKLIRESGAEPAFLNYKPDGAKNAYKYSICASLNDVVVHGIPTNQILKSGDILKLDFGVKYDGFYTDAALTIPIGKISAQARKLIGATKMALDLAIEKCQPGNTLGDIGFEIENTAKKFGFKPVKSLTGHGIGLNLHEEPTIYNYGEKGKGILLRPGMVLAIEPMFSAGAPGIIQCPDESWATKDGNLSSHFEHTVAIGERGPVILTI